MILKIRAFLSAAVVCALIYANPNSLHATTIIKLNLGNVGPDVGMNNLGVFGTVNDGDAATTGDQDTALEYTGFLDSNPDISTPIASFTLSNLVTVGPPTVSGPVVIQNFAGGTLNLYSPSNSLLLSGLLTSSSLQGTIGPPGTGAVFTTNIATVTGGSLAPSIVPNSLGMSMTLINVNGGNGFSTNDGVSLNPFVADSSVEISGNPTPEPGTLFLVTAAVFAATVARRRPSAI